MPEASADGGSRLRIAIFGGGAVGIYLAARLLSNGADVRLVCRNARDRRLPVTLSGPRPAAIPPTHIQAVDVATPERCDLGLVAVKRYHSSALATQLPAWLADGAALLTLQNGLDAHLDFAALGCPVVAGTIRASVSREPGGARYSGPEAAVELPAGPRLPNVVQSFATSLERSNIAVRPCEDIERALWSKAAFVASYGGVCAVTRRNVGSVREAPELSLMVQLGFEEAAAIGAARGIEGCSTLSSELCQAFARLPAESRPSLLDDVLCARPLEVPWLSGALSEHAASLGIRSPVHDYLTAVLDPN